MVCHEVSYLEKSCPCVIPVLFWYLVGLFCLCCATGGIGLVSSEMMCGTRWGGRIGACPGWNVMYPCGSTLRGGAGSAYGVVSRVCTPGGGVICRGAALLNISASLRSAAF